MCLVIPTIGVLRHRAAVDVQDCRVANALLKPDGLKDEALDLGTISAWEVYILDFSQVDAGE